MRGNPQSCRSLCASRSVDGLNRSVAPCPLCVSLSCARKMRSALSVLVPTAQGWTLSLLPWICFAPCLTLCSSLRASVTSQLGSSSRFTTTPSMSSPMCTLGPRALLKCTTLTFTPLGSLASHGRQEGNVRDCRTLEPSCCSVFLRSFSRAVPVSSCLRTLRGSSLTRRETHSRTSFRNFRMLLMK